ncbi:Transient receptor potential Ca2 channel (TRP-CC) family protein [Phytophthora cinnamomi]|uniref:Transient receptor potential Ca2 channel (TRP-CC) family protein n=1 Tax=Phytophthora cinnamomi TaxID=4785 RepID=UPI003559448F|nr:Transient receptor potential Ca2 channel (TRP-CC) family protein [Phytophthora cinnamomi]
MIRRPYLLFCEMIVTVQLGFMMYVAVNQLLNVPVIVECHDELPPRQIILFYSATVVWLVLLRQIVVFCRFLTHLKLQADSSNDSSHVRAGELVQSTESITAQGERTRLVKEFKKLLYRAVARGDVLTVETLLAEMQSKYRIDRIQDLYKPPLLWFYAFAKSRKNPLHIAVKRGNIRVVELLLEHGMDVNVLDKVVRVNFNVGLVFKIISRILVRTQDGLRSPLKALYADTYRQARSQASSVRASASLDPLKMPFCTPAKLM